MGLSVRGWMTTINNNAIVLVELYWYLVLTTDGNKRRHGQQISAWGAKEVGIIQGGFQCTSSSVAEQWVRCLAHPHHSILYGSPTW